MSNAEDMAIYVRTGTTDALKVGPAEPGAGTGNYCSDVITVPSRRELARYPRPSSFSCRRLP